MKTTKKDESKKGERFCYTGIDDFIKVTPPPADKPKEPLEQKDVDDDK